MTLKGAASLDYNVKEEILNLVSEIIEKSTDDQDGQQINRLERALNRFVVRQWNLLVTEAIKSVVSFVQNLPREKLSASDQKKIESRIEKALAPFSSKINVRIVDEITNIYKINRSRFQGLHKLSGQKVKQGILKAKFESTDQLIVESLVRLHLVAAGDHYANNHKEFISQMIKENVIDKGLPKKEAGKALREQLSSRLGGFDTSVPDSIRNRGQQAAAAYFEGLSATTVTRARNFGQIGLMEEAGVTQVVWSSVEDERTSEICLAMNGRVFTIDLVKAQQNKILEQTTAEAVKEMFPWRKDLSEFGLKRGDRLSSHEASRTLAENGVPIVPPAHFRCRSELLPA